MLFSEEKISEIIESNDIVDVISEYMNLKKSGRNFIGLCPFHSEKTPSFSVSPEKQIFHCFGCGAGGNVITFIQKIEKMSFIEAVKFLAERAHIDLELKKDADEAERLKVKKELYKINLEAARYFYKKLFDNQQALNYIRGRGLSFEIIKKFGLGYSIDNWNELSSYLIKKGFNLDMQYKAGLVLPRKDEKGYYDRFRNRIMFPIFDLKGNIIGFGGRVLDDSKPKYLNSPDTPVFHKGYNIYALNHVKNLQELKNIIIVEGYMDVIALHQYGIENAVASLGTAFTENQAKLLKRYSNEIIIAYDSDTAGQAATQKGLAILEKEGCIVKVLSLPSGKDPDEYIRREGLEAFKERIDKSRTLIEYKIESAKKNLNIDNIQERITFTKNLAKILLQVESRVELDAYIKKYSRDMQISEEAIYLEINRLKGKNINGNNRHNIVSGMKKEEELNKGEIIAERYIINICMHDKNRAKNIFEAIEPDDFSNVLHSDIAKIINFKIKEGKNVSAGEILNYIPEEQKAEAAKVFNLNLDIEINEDIIRSYIKKIKHSKLDRKIQELTKKMNELYHNGDREKSNAVFIEIMELQKMKKQFLEGRG